MKNLMSSVFGSASESDKKNYISPPFSDEYILEVEQRLGYKLPKAYIDLMMIRNGGHLEKTCFPTESPTSWANDHVSIKFLLGIGENLSYSLLGSMGSRFWIEEWDYPDIGVYFGCCQSGGHEMICLDYRACGPEGEPCVVYIDQECDYDITLLADNFELFLKGLVDESEFDI